MYGPEIWMSAKMMYSTSSILCCMDTTYDFLSHVSNQEEEIERRATEQDTVINMYTLSHTYPPSLLLLSAGCSSSWLLPLYLERLGQFTTSSFSSSLVASIKYATTCSRLHFKLVSTIALPLRLAGLLNACTYL